MVSADELAERVLRAHLESGVEGVTFLGGEPFLQAKGLAAAAKTIRDAGLSVMIFTGYTLAELTGMRLPGTDDLLAVTDVLVDGPFVAEEPERTRNWVGSSSQTFHYLTDRYDSTIEGLGAPEREVEVRVESNGTVTFNGWPTPIR